MEIWYSSDLQSQHNSRIEEIVAVLNSSHMREHVNQWFNQHPGRRHRKRGPSLASLTAETRNLTYLRTKLHPQEMYIDFPSHTFLLRGQH